MTVNGFSNFQKFKFSKIMFFWILTISYDRFGFINDLRPEIDSKCSISAKNSQNHVLGTSSAKIRPISVIWPFLLGVELKPELAGHRQKDMTHTNESHRSPPNSGFSCRITPVDKFYSYRREILIQNGFSDGGFLCKTDNSPQNRVSGDNLIIFCVQSDCTGVKMCDNTFSHGSKRYCVVIEGVRVAKW